MTQAPLSSTPPRKKGTARTEGLKNSSMLMLLRRRVRCATCLSAPLRLRVEGRQLCLPRASRVGGLSHQLVMPIPQCYDPEYVERQWMEWWVGQGYFTPSDRTNRQSSCLAADSTHEDASTAGEKAAAALAEATKDANKFIMVIPPPNVTGSLHIGHALTIAIEDALARWNRMRGKLVLWVPGVDHAGIATQSVVERMLMKEEGKSRYDLGREAFVEKVWQWKEKYGNAISDQIRYRPVFCGAILEGRGREGRVGSSVSWPHFSFTLDPTRSKAVVEAFVRLFNRGLIYREQRLVSWSSSLKTALSDIEVDTETIEQPQSIRIPGFDFPVEVGYLWHFVYPVEGGGALEVATTRIETMLGDTAVAVNPNDTRYKPLIGKRLLHPFFPEREMRVIADAHVDPEFGTGAVKITPAHDKNDYEIGKRHKLDFITIFSPDGHINERGGEFAGQHRFTCRYNIQIRLKELGLLRDKVPNSKPMQLPRCSRSGDIIEYMLVPQWWMDCKEAGRRSVMAVRSKELIIKPEHHVATWEYWLTNVQDWCISRQLWWGHRIPAYKVVSPVLPAADCNMSGEAWVAARSEEEAKRVASERFRIREEDIVLQQDEDVLDTWFSSGLFPLSVFGWPEETEELKAFFPTTLLETGHDILFFWVARMVMLSLELTGKLPFSTVYLHPMVRDSQGQKMSKSKGNVIDPLEVINGISLEGLIAKLHTGNLQQKEIKRSETLLKKEFKEGIPACGCDALRLGLVAYMRQGRNINLDLNRVVGYRQFANKIWNCTKFALDKWSLDVDGKGTPFVARGIQMLAHSNAHTKNSHVTMINYADLTWSDRWILHRLSTACEQANRSFEEYEFGDVANAIYNFWLYELCDVYLEAIKPRIQPFTAVAGEDVEAVLARVRDARCAQEVLYTCIDRGLKLLHPICPFVTEELYQRLPPSEAKAESICISNYPQHVLAWTDAALDTNMQQVQQIVGRFRSLLAALEIPPKVKPEGFVLVNGTAPQVPFLRSTSSIMAILSKLKEVAVITDAPPTGCVSDVVTPQITIYLKIGDGVNLAQTLDKLEKKRANLVSKNDSWRGSPRNIAVTVIESYIKKVNDPNFDKAPDAVRDAALEKKADLEKELQLLAAAIDNVAPLLQQ
ncbi:valyl-tRNA synthetase [Cyclospora cayetanensis]|uniref:valine--tRNA ligase n=1 Tax=Cyclospora cayetanensis TaxID=88456 RepID=A0A1D3D2H1_9EIME|nr:valyl-tRNA synthetase [Cyclospora cayetanensis]